MSYIKRLIICYKKLLASRLVSKYATDDDALDYFVEILNDSNPIDPKELELKNTVRKLYLNNKVGFKSCIEKDPYYILLTESREIVQNFHIQNLVFIKWNKEKYSIELYNKNKYNNFDNECDWKKKSIRFAHK